jgi:hypothetical protein
MSDASRAAIAAYVTDLVDALGASQCDDMPTFLYSVAVGAIDELAPDPLHPEERRVHVAYALTRSPDCIDLDVASGACDPSVMTEALDGTLRLVRSGDGYAVSHVGLPTLATVSLAGGYVCGRERDPIPARAIPAW